MIDDPAKQQIESYAARILQPIVPQGAILGRAWNGMLLSVFVAENIYDALDARALLQAFSQLANFFAFLVTRQNVGVQASRGAPRAAGVAIPGPLSATNDVTVSEAAIHAIMGTGPAADGTTSKRKRSAAATRRRDAG